MILRHQDRAQEAAQELDAAAADEPFVPGIIVHSELLELRRDPGMPDA